MARVLSAVLHLTAPGVIYEQPCCAGSDKLSVGMTIERSLNERAEHVLQRMALKGVSTEGPGGSWHPVEKTTGAIGPSVESHALGIFIN